MEIAELFKKLHFETLTQGNHSWVVLFVFLVSLSGAFAITKRVRITILFSVVVTSLVSTYIALLS